MHSKSHHLISNLYFDLPLHENHVLHVKGVEQKLNEGGKKISREYNENFLKGNYDRYKNIMLIGSKKKKDGNTAINVDIDGINIL